MAQTAFKPLLYPSYAGGTITFLQTMGEVYFHNYGPQAATITIAGQSYALNANLNMRLVDVAVDAVTISATTGGVDVEAIPRSGV